LQGVNFENTTFNYSHFINSDLTGANLEGARIFYGDLSGAKLTGANLKDAYLTMMIMKSVEIDGANLENTKFNGSLNRTLDYIEFRLKRTPIGSEIKYIEDSDIKKTSACFDYIFQNNERIFEINEFGSVTTHFLGGQANKSSDGRFKDFAEKLHESSSAISTKLFEKKFKKADTAISALEPSTLVSGPFSAQRTSSNDLSQQPLV